MPKDFSSYLKVSMDTVPENIPYLPLGHFFTTIQGWKTAERDYDKANGGAKTPVVEITFKVTAVDDDVEEDQLPPGGGIGMTGTLDYPLNEPNMSGQTRIRQLAERTLSLDVKGLALEDVLDALKGQDCKVFSDPRADKNNEGVYYTTFKRVFPAT